MCFQKKSLENKKTAVENYFDDTTDFCNENIGNIEYCCEFCGIYIASKPRCNKCESE